jgi:hypothetical protein
LDKETGTASEFLSPGTEFWPMAGHAELSELQKSSGTSIVGPSLLLLLFMATDCYYEFDWVKTSIQICTALFRCSICLAIRIYKAFIPPWWYDLTPTTHSRRTICVQKRGVECITWTGLHRQNGCTLDLTARQVQGLLLRLTKYS